MINSSFSRSVKIIIIIFFLKTFVLIFRIILTQPPAPCFIDIIQILKKKLFLSDYVPAVVKGSSMNQNK